MDVYIHIYIYAYVYTLSLWNRTIIKRQQSKKDDALSNLNDL